MQILRLRRTEYFLFDQRHNWRRCLALAIEARTLAPAIGDYVEDTGGGEGVSWSLERFGGTRLVFLQDGANHWRHVFGHFWAILSITKCGYY